MRLLITGGTGFLGGALARHLLREGDYKVRVLGRDFSRIPDVLAAGAEPVAADLRDADAIARACAGMDTVVHSGALSAPWTRCPQDFYDINVGGTEAVIAGCRKAGVRRLVYVSSPSVLFDGRDCENIRDSDPYPPRFVSVYSETKKLGEDRVNGASGVGGTSGSDRGGLETVILRPKAIFGPGDTSLLPRLIAARAGRLPQIGDGANRLDLTYVDNSVHALTLALTAERAVGNTYTITNGEPVLLWPTIRGILRRLNIPEPRRTISVPVALLVAGVLERMAAVTGREPLLTRYTVLLLARTQTHDIAPARADLGYSPLVPVAEGIERTLSAMERL